jgi:hypothetical protein
MPLMLVVGCGGGPHPWRTPALRQPCCELLGIVLLRVKGRSTVAQILPYYPMLDERGFLARSGTLDAKAMP